MDLILNSFQWSLKKNNSENTLKKSAERLLCKIFAWLYRIYLYYTLKNKQKFHFANLRNGMFPNKSEMTEKILLLLAFQEKCQSQKDRKSRIITSREA